MRIAYLHAIRGCSSFSLFFLEFLETILNSSRCLRPKAPQ